MPPIRAHTGPEVSFMREGAKSTGREGLIAETWGTHPIVCPLPLRCRTPKPLLKLSPHCNPDRP